jgi:hypothetical protein
VRFVTRKALDNVSPDASRTGLGEDDTITLSLLPYDCEVIAGAVA